MYFQSQAAEFLTYHRDVVGNSAGEMAQKTMCLRNHLVPHFNDRVFDTLTRRDIEHYVAAKRKQGLSITTINHHLTILKRYLRYVQESGYLLKLPLIKLVKVPKKDEENYLTPAELQRLVIAADTHRRPGWRLLMIIAVNTGMRIGEILALDWKQVDIKNEKLRVANSYCRIGGYNKATKNNETRIIALNENAMVAFTKLHALEGYPEEGRVVKATYGTARQALQLIVKRAKMEKHVSWHTFRHTFATALISQGEPLFIISRLLGHTSERMSERYVHLTRDRRYHAVRKLNGIL
jgi:integrase